MKISEICRRRGFSEGTCYNWKAKHGELEASDLKRMKEPISELSQLKRMCADLALKNRAMKDLNE